MALIDLQILGPVVEVEVLAAGAAHLIDGPCAGRYEEEPPTFVNDLWAREGKPGGLDEDTQMWARYLRTPAGWLWNGERATTWDLQPALAAARQAGHDYRETYGV
jgi:hypothetical protein